MDQQEIPQRNINDLLDSFVGWMSINRGLFLPIFLEALQKLLAIAPENRPLDPAYAARTTLTYAINHVRLIELTSAFHTERFRGVVSDHDFVIQAVYVPEEGDDRELINFLIRLLAIYNHARQENILQDRTQKKFQFRFGTYTSNMYFINTNLELKQALFDALVKYYEHIVFSAGDYNDNEPDYDPENGPPPVVLTRMATYMTHRIVALRRELDELEIFLQDIKELLAVTPLGVRRNELLEEREALMFRIDAILEEIAIAEEYLIVHEDNEIHTISASATYIRFLARRGARIPEGLKLPKEISRSVINPAWDDHYCFFSCLEIADVYFSKKYNIFSHYACQEKNPELEEWSVDIADIDRYYNDEVFKFSPKNISAIEEWYRFNINIYDLTKGENGYGIRCAYRSRFKNPEERVVRILWVPYTMMEVDTKVVRGIKKQVALEEEFKLGSEEDIDWKHKSDGHFVLIPETSRLLCPEGEETNSQSYCPFCDSSFRATSEEEDSALFKKHKEGCRNFISNKSNEERVCNFTDNKPDSFKEFKNWYQLTKQPWICYSDTETQTTDETGAFQKHALIAYKLSIVCCFDSTLSYNVIRIAKTQEEMDGLTAQFSTDIFQMRCYIHEHSNKVPILDHNVKKYWIRDLYRKERQPEDSQCGFCNVELELDFKQDQVDFVEALEELDDEIRVQTNLARENKYSKAGAVVRKTNGVDYSVKPHLHHCKNTGVILGYLCQRCSKNESKSQKTVSVAFHNLPYDLLVLIKSFGENTFSGINYRGRVFDNITVTNDLEVIAQSGQKYSTITIKPCKATLGRYNAYLPAVKFIDTFRFISNGLSKIIDTMRDGEKDVEKLKPKFPHTWKYLEKTYGETFAQKLFPWSTEKGLIAYDKINLRNLESKTNLPMTAYNNSLAMVIKNNTTRDKKYKQAELNRVIALKEDYARTNKVYNVLAEYHGDAMCYREFFRFYLELDILLLTDYFESLRSQLISTHRIDPAYHQGLASYSQNCMLYFTRSRLHLIEPVDVSKLIIDNCRGGFSGVMKRISENYEKDPQKVLKYWDANNLYGFSMIQKLANKFLGEIPAQEFLDDECESWSRDGDFAYFVLVDYHIPLELHDRFAKFAPLISKKSVKAEEVSFENRVLKEIRVTEAGTKLCSTLEDGSDYLMDWENFLFYERMGYEMTVKRVFKYEQSAFLKPYIDKNSTLRQASTTALFKQLYKDLNNICYGKSLQNPMRYGNVELITSEKILQNRVRNPLLKRLEIIVDEKLVLTDLYKEKMKFDTCIQFGFAILEKSKHLMYSTLYEKIVPFCARHNVKWELLLHDTDSLAFEFLLHDSPFANEKEMIMAMHKEENDVFDMHIYTDPELKDGSRKKVVGYFLDEYSDNFEIVSFVGLAAKSYCYVLEDVRRRDENGNPITQLYKGTDMHDMKLGERTTVIKGKGMRNSYLEALFDYRDFKKISQEGRLEDNSVSFNNMMKKDFGNTIATISKVALSSYDDKWYLYKEDGETKYLPYGHYKIVEIEMLSKNNE